MKITHVYHGSDDQTHFEEIDWIETPTQDASYTRTEMRNAGITMFAIQPAGYFAD